MRQTAVREYPLLKKRSQAKAHDVESPEIVITLNRKHPSTRKNFVIDALLAAGSEGVFVNELLRGWNDYRDKIGKSRSNYAAFRKLVWDMKKKGIIECIPDGNKIPRKDRKGKEMFTRSYYRLTRKYIESEYGVRARCQ